MTVEVNRLAGSRDVEWIRERMERVDRCLEAIDDVPDEQAREAALEAVNALLLLYEEGLRRVVGRAEEIGGDELLTRLAEDDGIARLLAMHRLHPLPVRDRVESALSEIGPVLQERGDEVDRIVVEQSVARLRIRGAKGEPASAESRRMIREAVVRSAPELTGVELEDVTTLPAGLARADLARRNGAPAPGF